MRSRIENEFVPYEQALELKELGFDEPCLKLWEKTIMFTLLVEPSEFKKVVSERYVKAPTFSQAFRWFREKYELYRLVMPKVTPSNNLVYYVYQGRLKKDWNGCFNTYEEAEQACLNKLIEIVKQ